MTIGMEDELAAHFGACGRVSLVRPVSVLELGQFVRDAAAAGDAVYPAGGGTMQDLGFPPQRPGVVVDIRGLADVVDYPARDMTITVGAGIALDQLRAVLGKENQRLPVDVPQADRATLGGVLAANVSGPRRYGFGTLRDYLIGVRIVNDEGREIKAGGRVVKNVAGYDLCKLLVGSLGTLGVIAEATLKLRPLPEEHAVAILESPVPRLHEVLDALHGTATRPVCLDLLNRVGVRYLNREGRVSLPEADWVLAVGFEDNRAALSWQIQQMVKDMVGLGLGLDTRTGDAATPVWGALGELGASADIRFSMKVNVLPRATAELCLEMARSRDDLMIHAHAGNGIVFGHVAGGLPLGEARVLLDATRRRALAAGGNAVIRRCPVAWKSQLPVWGEARSDYSLMRAIKSALDPRDIFNPGRFFCDAL